MSFLVFSILFEDFLILPCYIVFKVDFLTVIKCLEKDSCGGDSGGPLITKKKVGGLDIYTIIGITSWGPASCGGKADEYGIYQNVAYYNDWILNTIY